MIFFNHSNSRSVCACTEVGTRSPPRLGLLHTSAGAGRLGPTLRNQSQKRRLCSRRDPEGSLFWGHPSHLRGFDSWAKVRGLA